MKTKHLAALTTLGILLITTAILFKDKAFSAVLDEGETQHLIFMRLEEKLARDVYVTLGEYFTEEAVFPKIVLSEQRHTDSMQKQLDAHQVDDPIDEAEEDEIGEFGDSFFAELFSERYQTLVAQGLADVLEALMVGAFIEELDMQEIVHCPDFIVDAFPSIIDEHGCGLDYTDEKSLIKSYSNLLAGSEDHLRAFVKNIEKIIGEGNYEAQVLSQEEVDEILGR